MPEVSQIDLDRCLKAADQYCQYYAGTLERSEARRADPYWHEMKAVAELWRSLLKANEPNEGQLSNLESLVLAKWAHRDCGTAWICLATSIAIWLRSRGRFGLTENPWYTNGEPEQVILLV